MEEDFSLASRMDEELLIRTEDTVGRWQEHFKHTHNPAGMSSTEETVSEDSGEDSSITLAEVAEVVKKLAGKVPGMGEIRLEILKALDVVGLSWLTSLLNHKSLNKSNWTSSWILKTFHLSPERLLQF